MDPTRIACPCPLAGGDTRHPDGDTVRFRETMPFWRVESMRSEIVTIGPGATNSDILGMLSELYLVHGIESWSLQDDKGKPIPVNRETVQEHILTRYEIAADLAEVGDSLYMEKVVLPLANRGSESSRISPTDGSTSPQPTGSTPSSDSEKPSKRSSTSTTPTGDTGTISPLRDGASNSSRSRVSAA